MNISIIKPNGQIEEMKYYDILYFCQKIVEEYISESKENLVKFKKYRENYHFFQPYFDFVMLELKYIIINPFFYKNTYLLPYHNQYFIMNYSQNEDYNQLISKIPPFSFDFLPATDENIGLQNDTKGLNRKGFYIDLEGNIYKNTMMERHLAMAKTLLNQKLIRQSSVCYSYQKYINQYGENDMCDFMIEKQGFVSGCPSEQNIVIYNPKKLTQEQHQKIIECQIKYHTKPEGYYKSLVFR